VTAVLIGVALILLGVGLVFAARDTRLNEGKPPTYFDHDRVK
jgi:hypothetical protein